MAERWRERERERMSRGRKWKFEESKRLIDYVTSQKFLGRSGELQRETFIRTETFHFSRSRNHDIKNFLCSLLIREP